MSDKVIVFGVRGSIPRSEKAFAHYGGATTCIFTELDGQPILLDAGTGLLEASAFLLRETAQTSGELPPISLLISHAHLDHLLGLPLSPFLYQKNLTVHIYGGQNEGISLAENLRKMMQPPLWPVEPEVFAARVHFYSLSDSFKIQTVQVDTMEGIHPNGVRLFRLTSAAGHRVVFISDCTLHEAILPQIEKFAQNCDLLLCDGQYAPQEWESRADFGHNTWIMAAELGKRCHAKQIRIIHHDPFHDDALLRAAEQEVCAVCSNCSLAYAGEEIVL